jgi:hypothetical protein
MKVKMSNWSISWHLPLDHLFTIIGDDLFSLYWSADLPTFAFDLIVVILIMDRCGLTSSMGITFPLPTQFKMTKFEYRLRYWII